MSQAKINENNIFTVVTIGSSALTLILATCGLIFVSWRFAAGIAAGGFVAIGNSQWLKIILDRAMGLPPRKAARYVYVRYVIRLGAIAALVSLLIIYGKINIIGLLIGLSVMVITILATAIYLATIDGGKQT